MSSDWRDYENMPREQMIERLRAAESTCVYIGWTGVDMSTRGKAAHELWNRWARLAGVDTSVKGNRDLADSEDELVAARDATRAATLARLVADDSDSQAVRRG